MRGRSGFTLVEMLVAAALAVFIMVILSEAFVASLESMRQLKAIGLLNDRLRTAAAILRRDLDADHFEGRRRLSDAGFWNQGAPREGFVRVFQGSASILEGVDGWNIPSYRSQDHCLHLFVKLRGQGRGEFFSAAVPTGGPLAGVATNYFGQPADANFQDTTGQYQTALAEVAYFLVPNGTFAGSTSLCSLWRTQLAVVPDNSNLNWGKQPGVPLPASALADYGQLSCRAAGANLYFNNPEDLADPARRVFDPGAANITLQGASLLVPDVLSFNIRVLPPGGGDFVDLPGPFPASFDTGAVPAPAFSIRATQITLRVWDLKSQQTRQLTIVQEL
jgi:prepilin-type N-terminal cleavage/methylation domain-containing protein